MGAEGGLSSRRVEEEEACEAGCRYGAGPALRGNVGTTRDLLLGRDGRIQSDMGGKRTFSI